MNKFNYKKSEEVMKFIRSGKDLHEAFGYDYSVTELSDFWLNYYVEEYDCKKKNFNDLISLLSGLLQTERFESIVAKTWKVKDSSDISEYVNAMSEINAYVKENSSDNWVFESIKTDLCEGGYDSCENDYVKFSVLATVYSPVEHPTEQIMQTIDALNTAHKELEESKVSLMDHINSGH